MLSGEIAHKNNHYYYLECYTQRNSSFHEYSILGATPRHVTTHDYLSVTM